jgi:hypothetical protein
VRAIVERQEIFYVARKIEMTGTTLPNTAALQSVSPVAPPSAIKAEALDIHGGAPDADSAEPTRFRDDPRVPAMLISTIVHTLLLVLLALFSYRSPGSNALTLRARQSEPTATVLLQAITEGDQQGLDDGSQADQPINVSIAPLTPTLVTSPLTQSANENLDPQLIDLATLGGGSAKTAPFARLPKGGLSARNPSGRVEFGGKYGATKESEQAVDAALRWLALHQRPNGSWSFDLELDPCNGQCRHSKKGGETPTPSTGATGLALLAFLGAGHTHHDDGPYAETVRRGIYYLRAVAAETEAGYDWQQGSMYGHGIALMALSEALAMTTEGDRSDRDLRDLVSSGASFTAVAQHQSGSWGYVPGRPGDMTVSGWQVLSLIAAKRSNIDLHTNTLSNAKKFVMSTCTDRDYWFGYKGPPGEPTTTAIGLTLMLYLGESPEYTPFYLALCDLAERGPTLTNIYHDYYATLALHHCRHRDWDRWNTKLRDHLVATQAKSGHEEGSWHFQDRWGDVGGRLYTTAMCAMTLEVYYRYLPLYGPIEDFPLQ